jgi:DNA (cytosine-5)-methyltransferase 1
MTRDRSHIPSPPVLPARPRIGSLCTGYGGLDLATTQVLGGQIVWVADPDPNVSTLLAARYPDVPNLGDITSIDWATVPPADVITAGFPCQDISTAGRGAGITAGARSGIWTHIAHAIGILQPRLVFVENVAALRWPGRGLDIVLADLATRGYHARWTCLAAADVGAPHRRNRLFLIAWPHHPHPTR